MTHDIGEHVSLLRRSRACLCSGCSSVFIIGGYSNRERIERSECCDVRPTRKSCQRTSAVDLAMHTWCTNFVLVLHKLDETMTRGGDKPRWVYVPAGMISLLRVV